MLRFPALLPLVFLAACATSAESPQMTAAPSAAVPAMARTGLSRAIAVDKVAGGEATLPFWISKVDNPEFTQALRNSLAANGLAAPDPAAARYVMRAQIEKLIQPLAGIDMTVLSSIKYTLIERASQRTVYEELVTARYTATFNDSPLGFVRLKRANEGSIRKNIEAMINSLGAKAEAIAPLGPAAPARGKGAPAARTN